MKGGWAASTTDISQFESVKVTRPPVPATLPVKFSISSKKIGSRIVTVNDRHFDLSTFPLNAAGRPNAASFAASVSHNAQAPSVLPSLACNSAGRVIEPRLEAVVI